MVEMILNRAFVSAGHKDKLLDAGGSGLLNRILDQRLVDDWQHFLGHGLGSRQKTGAKTANRKNGFFDHKAVLAVVGSAWYPWIQTRPERVKKMTGQYQ